MNSNDFFAAIASGDSALFYSPRFLFLFLLLFLWPIPWKGFALWRSAQHKQPLWFICFLLTNTVGILEILYIFFFQSSSRSVGEQHEHE